jgi:hypothetical protein
VWFGLKMQRHRDVELLSADAARLHRQIEVRQLARRCRDGVPERSSQRQRRFDIVDERERGFYDATAEMRELGEHGLRGQWRQMGFERQLSIAQQALVVQRGKDLSRRMQQLEPICPRSHQVDRTRLQSVRGIGDLVLNAGRHSIQ